MAHYAERFALDQLVVFFDRHIYGEKPFERDDGLSAQEQFCDKQRHVGERKHLFMRQRCRWPMSRHVNPRRDTCHDHQPQDAQRVLVLLRLRAAARAVRRRQEQFRDQVNESELERERWAERHSLVLGSWK